MSFWDALTSECTHVCVCSCTNHQHNLDYAVQMLWEDEESFSTEKLLEFFSTFIEANAQDGKASIEVFLRPV